jgi:hypothetical protein
VEIKRLIFNRLMKVSTMLDTKIEIRAAGGYDTPGRDLVFANDSWSHWHPDPERAFREHDPGLVPYALMSRRDILACMRVAKGGQEWEFYQEFLIDKCTEAEREYACFVAILVENAGVGRDELCYVHACGGMPTRVFGQSESAATIPGDVPGG